MRDPTEGQRLLAASHAYLGEHDQAARHGRLVLEAHPNFSTEEWRQVAPIGSEERLEHYLEGLRRAGLP